MEPKEKALSKQEAVEIIKHFESLPADELVTRKEMVTVIEAVSAYLCFEIADMIVRNAVDNCLSHLKKT
jgi:hypothetical protein